LTILNSRTVSLKGGSDRLVWDGAKSGNYKTKKGYKILIKQQLRPKVEIPLRLCWDKNCLPKARMFAWMALQKKILTADRFTKMGYEGPSRCPLCEKEQETTNHILLDCQFSNKC